LVAKRIKHDKREDSFSATPPLEAEKLLFSLWANMEEMCLDFIDVVRAYFHTSARREMHVDLLQEDHEEGMCGKVGKAMYGTRDAVQNSEVEYRDMKKGAKVKQGAHSACVFYHGAWRRLYSDGKQRGSRMAQEGDWEEV
jgi:hypothetical protein